MQGRRLRALVLAAGLGTRLRPLTESTPKPLLPVAGVPILGHTLAQLAALGCEATAINLHYQGDKIRARLGDAFAGMPLTYSEEPEILGTLGALHPLRDFFAPADLVLLVNGDSLCRWPLRRMVRRHLAGQPQGTRATLLLTSRPDPAAFGGGVGIDREGWILSFRNGGPARQGEVARRHVFAGAHVISPELLARVGPGRADIVRDLYEPLLTPLDGAGGARLAAVVTAGLWHDMGTPQRFLDGTLEWARASWPERLWRRSWISPEAGLAAGALVRQSSIEPGARVGEKARVERSILLSGARVGAGCVIRESIVGFGASVPPGTWVERRVITAQREGATPGLDDSVVGGAVYTPFAPAGEAGG
ncbi:MAG TPA: NDP-sugar synthase [Thermoanaerobaculia bacterium]|nr:NDP-sugar synthase [Thermoanaerobaculia bacterium]